MIPKTKEGLEVLLHSIHVGHGAKGNEVPSASPTAGNYGWVTQQVKAHTQNQRRMMKRSRMNTIGVPAIVYPLVALTLCVEKTLGGVLTSCFFDDVPR